MKEKKAESFSEVSVNSIKIKKLEEELDKTKKQKERVYNEFMEYKYDHMPSEIKRGLERCYMLLTGKQSLGSEWIKFKIEFMEFCEGNYVSRRSYEEAKKMKELGIDDAILPFLD